MNYIPYQNIVQIYNFFLIAKHFTRKIFKKRLFFAFFEGFFDFNGNILGRKAKFFV